jgi:hypothetical protein
MSPALAHARGLLAVLHPACPAAHKGWISLFGGACGLAMASQALDNAEVGARLIAAMFLFFAAAGLGGLQQAAWQPRVGDLAPLPIGRATRRLVELVLYTILASTVALPLAAGMAMLGAHSSLAFAAHDPMVIILDDMTSLMRAVLLVLPLLVAIAPGETRHGPIALLRLLLPWLPLGVASSAGWLAEPTGFWLTLAAMGAAAVTLLALRSTGWEDWWPRLPDLSRHKARARRGLPIHARLAADFRAGLRDGLGWGLGLSVLGWLLMAASSRGIIGESWAVAAVLLMAGAFMVAIYTSMNIPRAARIRPWRAGALPWSLLPLPHGAMQRGIHSAQSAAWLVLVPVHLLALWLSYLGLPGPRTELFGAEFVVGMLVAVIPAVMSFEARFTNASRPAGLMAGLTMGALGIGTAMVPLLAATALLGELPMTFDPAPLSALAALQRLLAVAGPATLLGLAWLAMGRVLIQSDMARQHSG